MRKHGALACGVLFALLSGCAEETGSLDTTASPCASTLSRSKVVAVAGNSASLQLLVDSIAQQVASARGLSWRRPIAASWVPREHLPVLLDSLAKVLGEVASDSAAQVRAACFGAMGFADSAAYRSAEASFDSSSAAAFYMIGLDHLWALEDVASREDFQALVAHELVHGLQDQNYGLSISDTAEFDEVSGYEFIVEGDAEYFYDLWELGDTGTACAAAWGSSIFLDLPASVRFVTSLQLNAPLAVSVPGYVPYLWGPGFVQALRLASGWPGVNAFLAHRPTSSTQGLHPSLALSRQGFSDWDRDASFASLASWSSIATARMGELYLATLLYAWGHSDSATQPATGWRGDRFWFWRKGNGHAVTAVTAWSDSAAAATFLADFRKDCARRYGGAWNDSLLLGGTLPAEASRKGTHVFLAWGDLDAAALGSLPQQLASLGDGSGVAGRSLPGKRRTVLHPPPRGPGRPPVVKR